MGYSSNVTLGFDNIILIHIGKDPSYINVNLINSLTFKVDTSLWTLVKYQWNSISTIYKTFLHSHKMTWS
jgi:hypothetical protein